MWSNAGLVSIVDVLRSDIFLVYILPATNLQVGK